MLRNSLSLFSALAPARSSNSGAHSVSHFLDLKQKKREIEKELPQHGTFQIACLVSYYLFFSLSFRLEFCLCVQVPASASSTEILSHYCFLRGVSSFSNEVVGNKKGCATTTAHDYETMRIMIKITYKKKNIL